ncbi:hypothetical protein IW140_005150 [Coemansia sp. RSA 1813]|nr:hypothetical protein EV178_005127 [Coemansia sp. RSA 1646]KAJ1768113.1 hypothetical protein LPJ74_005012 [Coemansia sp. RSA 1843]KAJ2088029.1 hypothetical protein IW138_004537 [Coemansia sp. RSA 986]KAJ2211952.1 hypothetical protein EV179_005059 [Coemansia sp. RSA 487]KAJ2565868.1 hypothetical protein IW140_005150 [Coemansia sp. RSA 1813]
MGILQKDRHSTKGSKPPIPVPDCWIERIKADIDIGIDNDSDEQLPDDIEADIMHNLRAQIAELAAKGDTTWLEQSKRLKVIDGHLLGLQRLAEVSSATLSYLRTVAIPIFVECYFLPSDLAVRRQAIPLIKQLSLLDPSCVDNVLQANLLAYIGAPKDLFDEFDVFDTADSTISEDFYAKQPVRHRAQALEVLATVPQGFPVIRRFVSEVLAYAAGALDNALPLLHSPMQGLGSVEITALRDDCGQTIRLVFLCISKLMFEGDSSADIQEAILASMRIPSRGFVEETLLRVYQLCWDLISCEHASLNSRQVAALVHVSLIEGSGLTSKQRAILLSIRTLDIEVNNDEPDDECKTKYLPTVDDSPNRLKCIDDAVAMVCVARAIVSQASYHTTLAELDIVSSPAVPVTCRNVHEAAFTHIASVCGRSQLAPGVKVVVFESMAIWLQETAKLLERCVKDSKSDLCSTAFALGQRVLLLQRERIMGYLWTYWDDPVDAVQIKIKAIFEAFLDIGSAMNKAIVADPAVAAGVDSNAFLSDVLDLVLTMDWSRKVKYSLLATLSARIDLFELFTQHPDVLHNCFDALAQVSMASRVATLLSAFLERAASDMKKDKDALAVEKRYVTIWAEPVVVTLCKDDDTSRRMLAQYVLPRLFEALPGSVGTILRQLSMHCLSEIDLQEHGRFASAQMQQRFDACRQHALIIVLKAARAQDLVSIEQLAAMDAGLIEMLGRAVYHPDWSVRADMLGLLCEARKLSTPLHEIELSLLFRLLHVSSNAPSADFRQQQHSALTVLATRLVSIATHADRIVTTGRPPVPSQKMRHREKAKREAAIARGKAEGKTEKQVLCELGILPQDEMVAQARVTLASVEQTINKWLDLAVRGCLYPGAGFSKVAMGLRWLDVLCSFFTPGRPAQAPDSSSIPFVVSGLSSPRFEKGTDSLRASDSVSADEVVTVLTQVLIDDPFEANRTSAFALLTAWPLVPSGDEQAAAAAKRWALDLLKRALFLVNSTRAGESESGALIVRWIFRKFVVLQRMDLDIGSSKKSPRLSPELSFAYGLTAQLKECQSVAERNLLDAAQQHPMHGLLTALQYVVSEINYTSPEVQNDAQEWRQWLADLTRTATSVTNVVLGVLTNASPEGNIPSSYSELEDRIDRIINTVEDDESFSGDGYDDGNENADSSAGPKQQVILSYCWRAVKEVSGLLAAVATYPPGSDFGSQDESATAPLIQEEAVSSVGSLLRVLLTSIRHRGAFSAVHPAFTDVCRRMFMSPSAALNRQVGEWLDQCLDIATICKVSVTRRSAGWPLCLLSILTCDKHATQALMPRAMDRLFRLAADLELEQTAATAAVAAAESDGDGTTDLPQVHAINMLRSLLDDHALAAEVVPYIEQAYILSLSGLRSRRWAIRNVCGLLYAALTRRVFGNNKGRTDTKYDGITGRELFTRFPGLHPFLTNQLEDAVDRMAEVEVYEEQHSRDDVVSTIMRSGARFIHPSLYPCLILLARLQPSQMEEPRESKGSNEPKESTAAQSVAAENAGVIAIYPHAESAMGAVAPPMNLDQEPLTRVNERNSTVHVTSASTMLSMYSFTELVELCVESPVYKTREMAARAFAPLIPTERAASVIASLLRGIQEMGETMATNNCHGTLCQVYELLRVHWRLGSGSENMCRQFIMHVFPALTALWPMLVRSDGMSEEICDVVRHKYLVIINEYVARGESWLLQGVADRELVRDVRLLLTRFRVSMLYGFLHPLFADTSQLLFDPESAQIPGAFGTALELTNLLLACIDDRISPTRETEAGLIEPELEPDSETVYNPWRALCSILTNDAFYEAKLAVLEWMADHARCERMEIFQRIEIGGLLGIIVNLGVAEDPTVVAASTKLLALILTKMEIDVCALPVNSLTGYWDSIVEQLEADFCPLSVSVALVELQAALIHMLRQDTNKTDSDAVAAVNQRLYAWTSRLYEWADPERAAPYRHAVSRALVTYSAIKRYIEAIPRSNESMIVLVDSPSEELLRLCYWRLLQDDDEDIRSFVAQSISRRLGRELACDQACEQLVVDFRPGTNGTAKFPRTYVANRLDYMLSGDDAEKSVLAAINPNRTLFDHENPNTYIDEPRNVQLAFYSLVTVADGCVDSNKEAREVFESGARRCVSALETALRVLVKSRATASEQGIALSGMLGTTSVSALFSLLQSWVLGARLALFVGTSTGDSSAAASIALVARQWLESEDLKPVHPWIARSLRQLLDMATGSVPVAKKRVLEDLFLLTNL